MINELLENLKQEMNNNPDNHPVYRNRTIAPDVFTHYALANSDACRMLLQNLGCDDVRALNQKILDYALEGTNLNIPPRNNRNNRNNRGGGDPMDSIYGRDPGNNNPLSNLFGGRGPVNVRPGQNQNNEQRRLTTDSFDTIYENACALQRAQEENHNTETPVQEIENNHTVNPSFKNFLKAFLDWAQAEEQTQVFLFMQEHNVSLDRLMAEDDNTGESILEELCTNLNKEAAAGRIDEVIGRESEILEVVKILGKRKKSNAVLLGKAGVGKTAIAEGLAKKIVDGDIPHTLENAVVYSLNVADMSAGTQFRGQFEEKLRNLVDEFIRMTEEGTVNPILFIDEIHQIVGAGATSGGSSDFANIIKPELANGRLRCVGATTEPEWNQFIKQNRALARRFDRVNVVEPTRDQAVAIIQSAKKYYEAKHGVEYSDEAIEAAVDLTDKYVTNLCRPDKGLDIFDYAGSAARVAQAETVTLEDIETAISIKKNIPMSRIQSDKAAESEEVVHEPLAPKLKEVVFGQDHAIDEVSRIVERSLAGLSEENKPIGSFIFFGPTGVGKTETAKQLAGLMECHFERIDMSEFMEKHTISGLIGAPAGYVGYGEVPRLAAINDNPHCVLLLDEIEKAHPDVQKLFLQALDNGQVKTRDGDLISFENVVIIMTSNAGARERATKSIGVGGLGSSPQSTSNANAEKAIKNYFLPEFLGRINSKITFNSLTSEQFIKVVHKHVKKLNDTKACASKNIKVTIDEAGAKWVVAQNTSPELGARPIEDAVRNNILDYLSHEILYGTLKEGNKLVTVTEKDNKLDFVVGDLTESDSE